MSNNISGNALLNSLLDTKAQNKPGQKSFDATELAKAKQNADQMAAQAAMTRKSNNNDVSYAPSRQAEMAAARMESIERAYQYSETMSLQLTTKEGDTVSVDFRQLYAQYQSYKETQAGQAGPQGVRYFESREAMEVTQFEEQFAFSVDGDLNEDELQAVFDVFEQVDSLSKQFFDGNIEQALQQAMELEIDFGQLSSFKLDLTQSESLATRYQQAALAQYNNVQQQNPSADSGEEVAEEYGVNMSDLPPYLQNWQQAIERLDEQFENAQTFLDNLMGEVTAQRFPEQDSREGWLDRVKAFHQQLADMAKADNVDKLEQQSTPVETALDTPDAVSETSEEANSAQSEMNR